MEAITSQQCYGELAMDAITLTFWALWMLTTVTAVARYLAISPLRRNLKVRLETSLAVELHWEY